MSTQICTGSFVATASTPYFQPLEQYINKLVIVNQSKLDSYTSGRITQAEWNDYMVNGIANVEAPTTVDAVASVVVKTRLAQNGITIFNPANPPNYAVVAISSFTPGTTTVWTTGTAHGFQVGDTVSVYGLTSAPQFGGLSMTVTAVGSPTTFTTLLDSTGATTSVGFVIKTGNYLLPTKSLYYPKNRVIAKITNANPMVVTTLVQQNYAVGDVVTFEMPTIFGMPQLSSLYNGEFPVQYTVIAANNAVGTQTVTLAVNSTNFGVFATSSGAATNPGHWPLAAGYPFSFPYMTPQGEGNINNFQNFGVSPAPLPYANQDVLSFARQNQGYGGFIVGAGDGTAASSTGGIIGSTADTFTWIAYTSLQAFPNVLNPYYV